MHPAGPRFRCCRLWYRRRRTRSGRLLSSTPSGSAGRGCRSGDPGGSVGGACHGCSLHLERRQAPGSAPAASPRLVGSERRFVAATGIGLPAAETTPGSAAGASLEDLRGGVAQGGGRSRRPRQGDYRTTLYINYVAKRIVRAVPDRRVSFEWVKGHDGDLHNEAANRAARSVRRYNTYRIPASALPYVLDNIGQDIAACMLRDSAKRELPCPSPFNVRRRSVSCEGPRSPEKGSPTSDTVVGWPWCSGCVAGVTGGPR